MLLRWHSAPVLKTRSSSEIALCPCGHSYTSCQCYFSSLANMTGIILMHACIPNKFIPIYNPQLITCNLLFGQIGGLVGQ